MARLRTGAEKRRIPAGRNAHVCLGQFETSDEPLAEAFDIARSAGRLTLLTPSPYRRPGAALLGRTSLLCLNASEAAALGRDLIGASESADVPDARDLARAVFELGPEALVVTRGRGGATLYLPDAEPVRQPAFPVHARDTLGAGDAFAAGLAVGFAEGLAWPEIMTMASACGALTACRAGTFEALPHRAEVDALLAAAEPRRGSPPAAATA